LEKVQKHCRGHQQKALPSDQVGVMLGSSCWLFGPLLGLSWAILVYFWPYGACLGLFGPMLDLSWSMFDFIFDCSYYYYYWGFYSDHSPIFARRNQFRILQQQPAWQHPLPFWLKLHLTDSTLVQIHIGVSPNLRLSAIRLLPPYLRASVPVAAPAVSSKESGPWSWLAGSSLAHHGNMCVFRANRQRPQSQGSRSQCRNRRRA
jgi:hypothetical protein